MKLDLNMPIETTQPTVSVDAGLPGGTYRFQLVVVDTSGNRSRPAEASVTVSGERISPTGSPGGLT